MKRSAGTYLELTLWFVVAGVGIVWLWPHLYYIDLFPWAISGWRQAQAWFSPPSLDWRILMLPTMAWLVGLLLLRELFPRPTLWTRSFAALSLVLLGVRYELWRWFNTLNLDDPLNGSLSLLLFFMELIAFINTAAFLIQTIPSIDRSPEADRLAPTVITGSYQPTVDVLVPTYNEPLEVLRRTIIGCQAMRYGSHQVYLLDDQQRPEIRQLTEVLGCHYLARPDHHHAKAGNLNYGLDHTEGELVVVFDADFIPTTDFLTRTVGFFQDANVAMVQTPQNFYNEDPVSVNLGLQSVLTNEQTLFFRYIQPSRDATNSVICCGSSFVIRRSALHEIGGIPTESITEDFFTSLHLQSRGYRIKYLNEAISAGLSPENIGDYISQRLRWGQGTIQTLFCKTNLFSMPGLKPIQRLSHSLGLLYWFLSLPRLVFLTMPLSYLLFELAPLKATVDGILTFYLPYFLSNIVVFSWLTGGRRSAFWSDVYETLLCFPMAITIFRTLRNPFGKGFKVTPKGVAANRLRVNWWLVWPPLTLMVLSIVGLILRLVETNWSTVNPDSLMVNVFWTIYNLGLLQLCILVAVDVPQRLHSRFPLKFACQLRTSTTTWHGYSQDMSEGGASLQLQPAPDHPALPNQAELWMDGLEAPFPVTLRWQRQQASGEWAAGVQFANLSMVEWRALIVLLYCQPGQWRERSVAEHVTAWAWVRSLFRLYAVAETR